MMDTNPEAAGSGGDDIRASLEQAYDDLSADPVADPVAQDQPDEKQAKARDEKGRFSKGQEEKTETAEAPKQAADEQKEIKLPDEQPKDKGLTPPVHWKGGAKVDWNRLPRNVQQAILDDHAPAQNNKYESLERVLEPARQSLSMRYGSVENGLQTLLAYQSAMDKDPAGTIAYIAKERGIDLSQFGGQQAEPDQYVKQIQDLQRQIADLKSTQETSVKSQYQSQIDAFASDPRYPYFNDVRPMMGQFIGTGAAKTLEEAYDMAVYAVPSIRAELTKAQQEKAASENLKKVEAAKAAQTPKGVPGAGGSVIPSVNRKSSVRDDLEQVWDALAS
jgi:hypothetical protein